ncbi:MAG TPA: DinB family protein [Thermoanaerobaculia bacterium]|nr:DinB family protein [Thermoanaerobaculia bacterium]
MSIVEAFIAELEGEAATTRRLFERVPDERLSWKPHEKSMSLGELAYHIAFLPRGIADLLTELVVEVPNVPRHEAVSREELVSTIDQSVPHAIEMLRSFGDDGMRAIWRMTMQGRTLLELPRLAMFRSVMLNHWYHHRGQLTVYLRMLDIPLPSVYGPTADEQIFG